MEASNRPYAIYYQEKNAVLISERTTPGTRTKTIVRFFQCDLPEDLEQRVIEEMDEYTASKNQNKQRFVVDPSLGKTGDVDKKFSAGGVWRLVSNAYNPPEHRESGLYQTLAFEYLTAPEATLVGPPLDDFWRGVDGKAIIHQYSVYNTANAKNVMGIVDYYIVFYPNVAQIGVTAFEQAIESRAILDLTSPLSQPRFFSGTLPAKQYQFVKASNRPSEDGSASDVIAILCDTTEAQNTAIPTVQNWQQLDWKTFYTGTPTLPALDTILTNVMAVDQAGIAYPPTSVADQTTQSINATVYKVTGINFDRDTGLYHVEVQKTTALPAWVAFRVPTTNGSLEIEIQFFNQTPAWVQGVLKQFGAVNHSPDSAFFFGTETWENGFPICACQMRISLTEFKTISGHIWARSQSSSSGSKVTQNAFVATGLTHTTEEEHGFGGRMYVRKITTKYNEAVYYGYRELMATGTPPQGFTAMDPGPGGFIRSLGGNWVHFRQVTNIQETWSDITSYIPGSVTIYP